MPSKGKQCLDILRDLFGTIALRGPDKVFAAVLMDNRSVGAAQSHRQQVIVPCHQNFHCPVDVATAGFVRFRAIVLFIDQFNAEFSRDAMPMKGGFTDNYYLQLAQNIRRFKGARPTPSVKGFRTLSTQKPLTAWSAVTPEYRDFIGDTDKRNWYGWGGVRYTNDTGRNDVVSTKVACDNNNVYFYVKTNKPMTKYTDANWMQLLLDTHRKGKSGWKGYDFIVNRKVRTATTTTLIRLADSKAWDISYRAAGNEMTITIPRKLLELTNPRQTRFDFHWIDNVAVGSGDPADWWYNGDSAPDGRFNYRYENTGK
jgi:hypothetical protein